MKQFIILLKKILAHSKTFMLELTAVFFGVILAFSADRMWENHQTRDREIFYLQNLDKELLLDKSFLVNQIKYYSIIQASCSRILDSIDVSKGSFSKSNVSDILYLLNGYQYFHPSLTVYKSIMSSGDMKIFSDKQLVNIIVGYYIHLESFNDANIEGPLRYRSLEEQLLGNVDKNKLNVINLELNSNPYYIKNLFFNYSAVCGNILFLSKIALDNNQRLRSKIKYYLN